MLINSLIYTTPLFFYVKNGLDINYVINLINVNKNDKLSFLLALINSDLRALVPPCGRSQALRVYIKETAIISYDAECKRCYRYININFNLFSFVFK